MHHAAAPARVAEGVQQLQLVLGQQLGVDRLHGQAQLLGDAAGGAHGVACSQQQPDTPGFR